MISDEEYRLCGGTFLVLLLEAKGQRRVARSTGGRPSDSKSNPEIFGRLVYFTNLSFVMPESGRSFATFTSDYKMCRKSDSPVAMLTDNMVISNFNQRLQTNYYDELGLFYGLFENVIDWSNKGQWLIAALIELIEADDSIPSDALFHIRPYGEAVKKSEISNLESICMSSFLMGVWHYIVCNIKNNEIGVSTLEHLLESNVEMRAERKFVSDIGKKTALEISTSVDVPEFEADNYQYPDALEELLKNNPLQFIAPGVAAGVGNIQSGQIFVEGKQVVSMADMKQEEVYHTPFAEYLKKAVDFHSSIKTLLYAEKPRKFHDFYVCNDLRMRNLLDGTNDIPNISMGVLNNISRNFIISGTGGIGKSMMMRHLFFEAAREFNTYEILPIIVQLKNYTLADTNIAKFVYKVVRDFDKSKSFDEFEAELKLGRCLILLDGLDEVPSNARDSFENSIMRFLRTYSDNHIVISSRPTTQFIQFEHFPVMQIMPFDKSKALKLIDKLEYHDPEAKAKFREDLDKKLFKSHEQFASNPLLLTIMLMTYSANGEIPTMRHVFYAKAYETMARLHDATKGAYVRPLHTGISPEQFATIFSEFCARTYREEVLEFTEQTFTQYMKKVLSHQKNAGDAVERDFLLDLTDNLCIMYKEGEKYYFIHRSFQEYFAAVFFSNQMDDKLWKIGEFFENQRVMRYSDRTFDMMYDMIPERIDRFIFLPFLKALWEKCDENNGYWTFLDEMYPIIYAQSGQCMDAAENDPQSNIYNFIINEFLVRKNGQLYDVEWPHDIRCCKEEQWVSISIPRKDAAGRTIYYSDTVTLDKVSDEYIEENGEPEVEGYSWEIDTNDVFTDEDRFKQMKAFLEADAFPLKREYEEMRKFTDTMNQRINSKPESDDWFDDF